MTARRRISDPLSRDWALVEQTCRDGAERARDALARPPRQRDQRDDDFERGRIAAFAEILSLADAGKERPSAPPAPGYV